MTTTTHMPATIAMSAFHGATGKTGVIVMASMRGIAHHRLDHRQERDTMDTAKQTRDTPFAGQPPAMTIDVRQINSPSAHLDRASPRPIAMRLRHDRRQKAAEITCLGEVITGGGHAVSHSTVVVVVPLRHLHVRFSTRLVEPGRRNSLRA